MGCGSRYRFMAVTTIRRGSCTQRFRQDCIRIQTSMDRRGENCIRYNQTCIALACSCLLALSVCFHPSISSRTRSARALLLVWCPILVGSDEFWRSATALAAGGSDCARPCPRVWTSQVVEGTDSVEQRQTNACLLLFSGGTRPPGQNWQTMS